MLGRASLALGVVLGFWALALSVAATGQQSAQVHRVAILTVNPAATSDIPDSLRKELRDLGDVEDQNLVIDERAAAGKIERLPVLAAEFVALNPDVIVVSTTDAALAAKRATTKTPTVILQVADPVGPGSSLVLPIPAAISQA